MKRTALAVLLALALSGSVLAANICTAPTATSFKGMRGTLVELCNANGGGGDAVLAGKLAGQTFNGGTTNAKGLICKANATDAAPYLRFYGSTETHTGTIDTAFPLANVVGSGSFFFGPNAYNGAQLTAFGSGVISGDGDNFANIATLTDGSATWTITWGDSTINTGDGYIMWGDKTSPQVKLPGGVRVRPQASPPLTCDAGNEGNIYSDTSHALCWCDGTTWQKLSGAGTCS